MRTPLQGKFKNSTLVYSDLCHGQDQNQGFLISLGPSWVKEYLLNNKQIHGAEEFALLDKEVLETLIVKTSQNLALDEKKKITQLMKEGRPAQQVLEQTDTRFLSADKAAELIARLKEIKKQNSGSGRMVNIFGGIGLIVLTVILLATLNRIFYVLPILGLVMIVKGLMTKKMEYDS